MTSGAVQAACIPRDLLACWASPVTAYFRPGDVGDDALMSRAMVINRVVDSSASLFGPPIIMDLYFSSRMLEWSLLLCGMSCRLLFHGWLQRVRCCIHRVGPQIMLVSFRYCFFRGVHMFLPSDLAMYMNENKGHPVHFHYALSPCL